MTNLISANTPVKDTKYSNPTTLIDTPSNTFNKKKKTYPPILSHTTNNYRKMGPSLSILSRFHDKEPIQPSPSFHNKEPVPISPCPELLSSTKRLKNGFVSGFINKKLNFDEDPMKWNVYQPISMI